MLAKKKRLTTEQFDLCFNTGKRNHGSFVQLVVKESPTFHAAVVVGKKVFKNAVDRNRLRRRLYDVIRTADFKENTFICLVKPQAKSLPYKDIRDDLKALLAKQALKQVQ